MKLILTCLSTTCVTITNVTSNAQKHRKIPVFFPSCFAVPTFPGSSRCKILVDNCLQFLCRCMKTCCLPLGVHKKKNAWWLCESQPQPEQWSRKIDFKQSHPLSQHFFFHSHDLLASFALLAWPHQSPHPYKSACIFHSTFFREAMKNGSRQSGAALRAGALW